MAEQLNEVTVTNYQNNSPFYYDKILINYITTVSLHPNTILKSELDDEENYEWSTVEKADPTNVDDDGYSYKAIVRAPYLDDYILNSQNNWSEFGEDEIGKAWNSLKPWEPYLKRASEEIGSMIDTTREKRSDQGSDVSRSFIGGFLENALSITKGLIDKASNYMGRSLVSQGARFSYYSGTSTTFGNLSMKFTVFSGWCFDTETGKYSWKTVDDQLRELYPYVMGKYMKTVGKLEEGDAGMTKEQAGEANEIINEFLAWQMPPAGYSPDLKTWDNCVHGTLKLKFGSFYSIPALICSNAQFNFSRQMVKNWDPGTEENKISPLYCDVILNFQPSTKFSDDAIISFMNGKSTTYPNDVVTRGLGDKLDKVRQKNENFLNGIYE